MRHSAILLAGLQFGAGVLGDASANYTDMLLSSGKVKLGEWQDAYEKAVALVKTLNTTEKLSIIAGGSGGDFPALAKLDSSSNPLGYYYVTTWPAGLAMAMTWDRDAIHGQGAGLGAEFKGKGINVALAPTLEPLGRSAWCGRTGEAYGPDSYLAGALAGQFVKGLADAGVVPLAKHFIMNEQETNRSGDMGGGGGGGGGGGAPPEGGPGGANDTSSAPPVMKRAAANDTGNSTMPGSGSGGDSAASSDAYSITIGDKAFHETYLAPFYDAVKSGAGGAMCAMNRVNGTYSCESQALLGTYLKVELGFPGLVNADVGGQHTSVNSANAGMDVSDGSTWSEATLGPALTNGSLTAARLDDMVVRNAMGYYRYGQDKGYPSEAGKTDYVEVRGNHGALARKYAAESIALLKNTDGALPLKDKRSISIFGAHAAPRSVGASGALVVYDGVGPTMAGHMYGVGGSAMGTPMYVVTPFQKFVERAASDGFALRWWLNDTADTSTSGISGGNEIAESTTGVAANSDACVVFLNAWAGEGGDRSELTNADQDNLVNTVADNCNNTIVVINTIGPRLVDQWIEHENVTGVLYGGPLGQASGHALDDVLFGAVNPSGKLVHTIAKNESDYDQTTRISSDNLELDFAEGNYVDYKYFDRYNVTPRYAFGYGLSYTTFAYGEKAEVALARPDALGEEYATGALAVGGREDLWDVVATVEASVANTGGIAGAEVAQLYVGFPAAADAPGRQLRGFRKVAVQPEEMKPVRFELKRRDLSVWDVAAQNWKVARGEYTFYVGASSRDIKAQATLVVQ